MGILYSSFRRQRSLQRLKGVYTGLVLLGIILCMFTANHLEARDYTYINIDNPFMTRIPFAIPDFKTVNGLETEKADGATAVEIMSSALDFTGYIQVMNPAAFLSAPSDDGIRLTDVNFRDWTAIGAEFLITGLVLVRNDDIRFELRMFDTFKGRLAVGKVYTGPRTQIRTMIHKFCGEISYYLTGKRGVFDTQIAFVSTVDSHKEIFVSDFDGSNPKQITFDKSINLSPAWSHDSNWLAYTSYAKGKPDLYIKHLKENRGAIVNFKGLNISPDWMPGKFVLGATLSFSGDQEIYLLTGKGEIIKRLTNSWGTDVSPSFSPDGEKMAFVSTRAGVPQIYIMDLKTEQVTRLTFEGSNNTSPAWSPDGDKIVYVGIEGNNINIYTIGVDGGKPVQLTRDSGDNEDPAWSPDGSMIVFSSTRQGGVSKLFVMTTGGAYQRKLMDLPGQQTGPDWSKGNR